MYIHTQWQTAMLWGKQALKLWDKMTDKRSILQNTTEYDSTDKTKSTVTKSEIKHLSKTDIMTVVCVKAQNDR